MVSQRLRRSGLVASIFLLAALVLPVVEVADLFDDDWEDHGRSASHSTDRFQIQKRSAAPPASPEVSSPTGDAVVFVPFSLEPRFQSEPGLLVVAAPRPARPSFYPRYLERGPPALV